jgi:hypothetical protein
MDDFGYQKTSKKLTAKINYRRYLVLILLIISIAGFLVIAGEAYYLSIFKDNKKVITILPPSGPLKVANNQQHNELENVNTSAVYEEIFGDRKVDEEIGKTVVITQPEPPSPAKNIPLTEGYLDKEDDLEQQIGYTEMVSKTTNNNLKITNILAKEIIDPKKDNKPNNKDITKNSSKNPEKDNEKHDSKNLEPAISKLENKVKDQSLLFHLNQPPSKSQIITPILQHNKKDEKGEKNQSGQNEETVKLKQQSKKDEDLEESKKNLLVPKNNSGGIIIFNEQNKAKNKEILILDNRNQKPIKSQQNQKEDLQNKQNDKKSKRMMVQIAAMSSKTNTEKMWKQISKNNPKFFKGLSYKIEEVNLGSKGLFYRLKVGSFANQIEAEKFCNKYLASSNKKSNSDCLMVE